MSSELERLYQEARSALKAKDYDRASNLFRQILLSDENYKDASRLLAQTVKLRRRRWYNDTRLWGALGFAMIVVLGLLIAPHMKGLYTSQPSVTVAPTHNLIATLPPTVIPTVTETSLPAPTSIPLAWKRISLGQEFERDTVTAIAIDPKDPDVLYASMENAGVYKSIDGGLSWHPAHFGLSNTHVVSLSMDPQKPPILYAGTMDGIFKTEDGSENWSRIGEGNYLLMDPGNSSHLYAHDVDNLFESTDQGRNWTTVYSSKGGCPGRILSWAVHPVDGMTLFIGTRKEKECEEGVYQSNDSGHNWTLIKKTGFFDFDPRDLGMTEHSNLLAFGLDQHENLYMHTPGGLSKSRSNNGGMTWRTILEDVQLPATFDASNSVYFYCKSQLCKFNLDEQQRVRLGKPDIEKPTVITLSPHNPNTIYVAGEGISISKDGGLTWTKLNNGLGTNVLHLEAGLDDAGTLYLLSGVCWEVELSGTNGTDYELTQPLYLSSTGGSTWDFAGQLGCNLFKDADGSNLYRIGFIEGTGGNLWRSSNGGKSWKMVLTPTKVVSVSANPSQTGLLYITTQYFGPLEEFVSKDYGQTWERTNPLASVKPCYGLTLQFVDAYRPMAIDPSDGNHVFVIDNGMLLESRDSCDTTSAFATPPNTSMNSIAFDPNQSATIYAGTDSGAYVSFDDGQTWNEINGGLLGATVVYSIVANKDSNVYAATPYGFFKLESK